MHDGGPSKSETDVTVGFCSFVRLLFAAFLPPMLQDGVAFEAHPQNTIARFSLVAPHELLGFVIRDFGGLRVHPPTLLASTGVALDFEPGHSIVGETLDDVYKRMYHTIIHNHLQQLVRVLELHYNGKGWQIIRARLQEAIPRGHALEKAWLDEQAKTIPGKCFMRMRMIDAYNHVSFLIFSLSLRDDSSLIASTSSIYMDPFLTFCTTLALTKKLLLWAKTLKYGSFRTSYKVYLGVMRRSGSLERMHAYLTCGPENCFPSFLDHAWLPRSLLNGTWYVQDWCIGALRSGPRQRPVGSGTSVYFPVTRSPSCSRPIPLT